jgi:hypothetical protein
MSDLHKALGDISNIRKQVAQSTVFRGYGPATMAATGAIACLAAGVQAVYLPSPGEHIVGYVGIWVGMAILSAALTGAQMYKRSRRLHSGLSNEMIQMAVEQFLPSAAAGLLITVVLLYAAPAGGWMLPGLWQVIFGLGIFSSCRFLPRPMLAAGVWYLMTGLLCIGVGGSRALSPWTMGISYAVGQLLVAGVLFFSAREADDESQD